MIDLNVALTDSVTGQPVGGAVVRIDTLPNLAIFPPTRTILAGGPGTCNFYRGPQIAPVQVVVTVDAANYVPFTNGDFPLTFGTDTIDLVVPLVRSFKRPSRAQLGTVKATFQGLTVQTEEFGALPWFEPFLCSLNAQDRQAVYAAKHAAGDTHCFLSVSYAYDEPGQAYEHIPGRDFTQDLPAFVALVSEAIAHGFYVVVSLAADGQVFNAEGWTYGWQWGMNNMARVLGALAPVLPYCAIMGGYEVLGPGGNWTPEQLEAFYLQLRDLNPDGVHVLELGSGYCKWREGPNGETGWDTPAGQSIDVFLQEFPQPITEGDHWNGCQQLAARTLGPAKRNIAPANDGPWYLAAGTPRGPYFVSAFEWGLYWTVRGQMTDAQIEAQRAQLFSLGYATVN